jgi:hypothetical protein
MTLMEKPTRQVRRALARQSQALPDPRLTEEIIAKGAAQAAVAAAAAVLTKGQLTDAELQTGRADLEARLETSQQHPEENLGRIEAAVAAAAQEPLRWLTQRAAQANANATPGQCLKCQHHLTHQKYLSRGIDSRFGRLVIWRRYGWCPRCETWQFPADPALGLAKKAPASPYVQEISGLLVTKMPPEQAVAVAQRLGLDLSRCLLHREAHRQGLKAQARRSESLAQLDTWENLQKRVRDTEGPPTQPFTLVIEIDAWNLRERDDWGQTKTLREQGKKVERWHWVYMATVFRLDHRGQTAGQRAVIPQRGYVATRLGVWKPSCLNSIGRRSNAG